MSEKQRLPRLKIVSPFSSDDEADFCEVEQARNRFNYDSETMIVVEGELVSCYEDLLILANQDRFRGRDFLEVVLLPYIVGG